MPTTIVAAALYARWGPRMTLALSIAIMLAGMVLVVRVSASGGSPVAAVALLLVGLNGIIATLLPYAAESFALRVRGRATGWIAACTKAGGLLAQAIGLAGLAIGVATATLALIVPAVLALALVLRFDAVHAGARRAREGG